MKVALCLAAVFLGVSATPNGYYHQQYNYKTSSSSYKNNELQHKTDDQGYYSKDGDLEGRTKPKVSSNTQHTEYINPQLMNGQHSGYDAETDLTSHGNLLANSYGASIGGGVSSGYNAGSQYGRDLYSEGMASSDRIGGASNLYSTYGSGSQSSYGSSSLRTVASRLQQDLQQEIQEALRSQSRYSHQIDISDLESELHRNLTARLNQILQEQYGTQTIRGGQSYSLSEGRLQSRPNYEQQELENLQRQVENGLLQQLRHDYSYGSSNSRSQIYNQKYYESTTTFRPTTYQPIYPNLNIITTPRPYPEYPGGSKDSYYSQNQYSNSRISSNVRYTPVTNPLSITKIASNVQNQVDTQLNRLLEQAQSNYFSEHSGYNAQNLDSVLERLRQDLKNNLTYAMDEELRSQYGTQVQRNNYMYSVGSGGEMSGQYNYNVADWENLKRQVEDNLLTKLNRDFETSRQRWISRQQTQHRNYELNDNRYGSSSSNQRYSDIDYYRPTASSIVPLINTGVKGNQYQTISGSHQSSYGTSSGSSNLVDLQRQLQTDLSRQLQAAINQNKAYASRYSTSGSYGGGSFEEAYQRLYDDLQRNLTQQLQEYETGSSGYSNSYGSISDDQMSVLRSQLQRNLASQLQTGLQQTYSASASYSASSGSSSGGYSSSSSSGSYRATRGSQGGYGQYRSGGGYVLEGEDCQGDDANVYPSHRNKRSYGYRSRSLGLATYSGSGYAGGYPGQNAGYENVGDYSSGSNNGYYGRSRTSYGQQSYHSLGQEEDDSDTIQQVEPVEFTGQREIEVGQEVDNSDDIQQVEIDDDFGKLTIESQNKPKASVDQATQLQENSGSMQEGSRVNKLQTENHLNEPNRKPSVIHQYNKFGLGSENNVGQQVDDSDLAQPEEDARYGSSQPKLIHLRKPSTGFSGNLQSQSNIGQEVDNFNTQQIGFNRKPSTDNLITDHYGGIELGSHNKVGQQVDNSDLIQQQENLGFGVLQQNPVYIRKPSTGYSGHLQSQSAVNIGQEIDDTNTHIGQEIDDTRTQIGQEIDDTHTHRGQEIDDTDTQQVEDVNFDTETNTKKTLIKPYGPTYSQEIDNTHTTPRVRQSPHIPTFGIRPLIQSSTEMPRSTTFTSYLQPNYENVQTNSQPELINQEIGQTHVSPQNSLQNSKDIDNSFTPQLEDNSFSNLDSLGHDNAKVIRTEQPDKVNENTNYKPDINQQTVSLSTLNLPGQALEVFQQVETNITNQLESTIMYDISYSVAPSQLYKNILSKYQNTIEMEIQKALTEHSELTISSSEVKRVETCLKNSLELKIQNVLLNYGFTRENFEISSSDRIYGFNNQNTNVGSSLNYGGNRRHHYSNGRYPKPVSSHNFLQREINSQIGSNVNFEQQYTYNQPNYQSTANLDNTDNRQLLNAYPSPIYNYPNIDRNPWESEIRPTETNKPKPDKQYIEPPKSIVSGVDTQLDQNKLQSSNTQSIVIGPAVSQPMLPVYNQVLDYTPSTVEPTLPNLNPFDLSNFPPLPPPQSSTIPVTEPQREIPQQHSSSETLTSNTNQREPNQQSLFQAEREADLLIQKLREHNQNSHAQNVNVQQPSPNYDFHPGRNTYHRMPEPNYPNQYNVIQVKLEDVTLDQLSVINQIEKDFTKLIDTAVENQVITTSNYEETLKILEKELKTNLTECIDDTHSNVEPTELGVNNYSYLIRQKFEMKKIPDLKKYLEIKLYKRIREQLRKAYKLGIEDEYKFQYSPTVPTSKWPYRSPTEYEIVQVKLENITPRQLRIINQMEDDLNKEIEIAIEDHVSGLTSAYLSSYENYQKSLKELELNLKYNVTQCVQEASEPGISKYSDLIDGNFDQSKITKLEKYLEIKLGKKLKESLKTHFKYEYGSGTTSFDSNLNIGSVNYNHRYHNYQSRHNSEVHYGHTHNIETNSEIASEIEPIEHQHATVAVVPSNPYSRGVKGGKISNHPLETPINPPSYTNINNQYNVETPSSTPVEEIIVNSTEETITEKAGWWQRFENKVKKGASKLKQKISDTF